ncbi:MULTISPECIES: cold shock small protein YmcF [Enterobacteriaceae]|uniref:Cold-shock protein n=1 Tax=Atlantibacter subterraneus TaxID=255519 RepID=A0A3R9LKC4_9ENTR|nr:MULTISPECIES: cold-shock protein [Enterobacteriaceae]MDZ5667023.1 cold-shock protein [Atlantibacter hermannii]QFH72735.1 cold-shock protein [Enterobacter sp. E76]MDA3131283.1 cold-shock protein [Atlantibacter subterranea]MDV7023993.1 cold-shock protein [Atlantibacter subterranea]MDW2740918.1 cold-shock protein [Atlantibacter subterranea]
MMLHIHFRCPCCHGSQYRTSHFDVSEQNPFGAKCIFCKSAMVTLDNVAFRVQPAQISGNLHK